MSDQNQKIFVQHSFIVDKGQEPVRIDRFLVDRIENISRAKVQQGIEEGKVWVNGEPVKSNYKVKPADVIEVIIFEEPKIYEVTPEALPLDIVYEDDDILVVNKPAGMPVHPGVGNYSGTLANALAYHFAEYMNQSNNHPYLAHRIDKDTSGLLLVAKNEDALAKLSKQFRKHTIERTYLALVWGSFKEEEGTIEGNITRNVKDRKKFTVSGDPDVGKHAITHFKVLEDLTYVSLVQCNLETGRTHQIRVHMKHIGHPLFSDERYGGARILKGVVFSKYKQFVENCFSIMPRQALHAKSLGFVHPTTGEFMEFECGLPDDFNQVLERWRKVNNAYDFSS